MPVISSWIWSTCQSVWRARKVKRACLSEIRFQVSLHLVLMCFPQWHVHINSHILRICLGPQLRKLITLDSSDIIFLVSRLHPLVRTHYTVQSNVGSQWITAFSKWMEANPSLSSCLEDIKFVWMLNFSCEEFCPPTCSPTPHFLSPAFHYHSLGSRHWLLMFNLLC